MPITLDEQSEDLADVCRKAELACAGVPTTHAWPVVMTSDFRALPQVKLKAQETTPAAYIPSTKTIHVNEPFFVGMSEDEQLAVLVHEVGHAVLESADCFAADMFACQYGQEVALVAERRNHYGGAAGAEYAEALLKWREPDLARAAYSKWRARKLAGII